MRILFTFIGGVGHFHPLVPVARAAEAAGHDVAVACSGGLVPQVEDAGFRGFATSPPRPGDAPPPQRRVGPIDPADAHASEVEFAENFARTGAARHAVAVAEVAQAWRPDVVVRDEADLGSAVAAEVLGLPTATVLVLAAGTLVRPDLVGPPLAALRAEHRLPPDPAQTMLTRGQVLSPFAPSFRDPASPVPLPPTTFSYRPGTRRVPREPTPRPRVYVTLGTVFGLESGDLLERLVAGLADVDADVLMTVGASIDPADLGPLPPHLRVERFVPQADVLPTTDLVVSHGGSGSLMAALAHGLPSVLLPLGADQPHNARRAEDLGVAHVLDAVAATPGTIRSAIVTTLQDAAIRARAEAMADEVDALPGVDAVVPLLEGLVSPRIV